MEVGQDGQEIQVTTPIQVTTMLHVELGWIVLESTRRVANFKMKLP